VASTQALRQETNAGASAAAGEWTTSCHPSIATFIAWRPAISRVFSPSSSPEGNKIALRTTVAWTGLRQGEVLGLQWEDIDFTSRFVEVRWTVGYRGGRLMRTFSGSRRTPLACGRASCERPAVRVPRALVRPTRSRSVARRVSD